MKRKNTGFLTLFVFVFSLFAVGQVPEGIYGITNPALGGFFRFDPATGNSTFVSDGPTEMRGILGGCTPGTDGKFYGISSFGGPLNLGVIYSFDPLTGVQTALVNFKGPNGANGTYTAGNNLVLATDHYFYGMTYFGGEHNSGTIFRFDPVTLTDSVLYSFDTYLNTPFYGYPSSGFIQASDGRFYGMMLGGGEFNQGYVFQFDPVTAHFQPVFSFNGANGSNPSNGFVQGKDDIIYGVVSGGGANGYGVIFSIDLNTLHVSVLYNMDYRSGATKGSLIFAGDDNLYGLSFYGGTSLYGCFYRLNPATNEMTICRAYDGDVYGSYGGDPTSRIVQFNNGKLYYTLGSFVYPRGIIVGFDPSTMTDTVVSVLDDNTTGGMLFFQIPGTSFGIDHPGTSTTGLSVLMDPLNASITIRFRNPERGFVSLKIYDISGKLVATLMNEQKQSGEYSTVWNTREVVSGTYICRLQAGAAYDGLKIIVNNH